MLVGLDWAEPMMFLSLHVTCSCIFHLYVSSFIFIVILIYAGAFLHVSLSLSLSFFRLVALWHQNENPLRPKTLFCSGASSSSDTTPTYIRFHDDKTVRTFQRTFLDEAFIRNTKSFYQIFPILTFQLPSLVKVRSHCVASRSPVPP